MTWVENRFARIAVMLLPAMIVVVGCGVSLLPHEFIRHAVEVLTAWLYLSVPVGIAVGNCALSENDCP
jgi:hypothetical protein